MNMADDVAFCAQDHEEYLEDRLERLLEEGGKTKAEWQDAIQQRQVAQPDDFDDLTGINTVKRGAFVKWYPRFYYLPRNPWRRKDNGEYEHDDIRRGFRAFSAGYDYAKNGAQTIDDVREAFEKWHLTLMPKRYAYRHDLNSDGEYLYTATKKSYHAFAYGYEAGVEFYKEKQ